jgi:hypothetical protein
MMPRICLILLTIVLLRVSAPAQNTVGQIIYLKGTARLRHVDGKTETLTERNYARDLQPKQRLRPDGNGQVQIILCDEPRPVPIPAGKWYTVPDTIICSAPADSPIQRLIADHFGVGSRHRGEDSFILFPIESNELVDVVRPETATFRWAPLTDARVNLSVGVIGVEHVTWNRDGIPGADGSFADNGLRGFLGGVREKYPGAKLQLKIQTVLSAETTENIATFRLLPEEKEKALRLELANSQQESELLSHLIRTDIYLRYGLYIEAADAHEEALKLSPESPDLLKVAATLEEQAGNLKRSRELEDYLEELGRRAVSK